MKNNHISQNNLVKKVALFYVFSSASAFSLLQYIVSVDVH